MAGDPRALLTQFPGCSRLDPAALDALLRSCRIEEFPSGATLVTEGKSAPEWYCIMDSGAVQVSRAGLGEDEVLDYLTEGDILDPGAPNEPAAWSAVVVEQARCLLVPQALVGERRVREAVAPLSPSRGDLALFVRRVRDLLKGRPLTCPPETPVADAARLMASHRVGSVVVVGASGDTLGIVTDRDIRTKVVAAGLATSTPVGRIMSAPLVSVDAGALVFDGLLEMTRRNIHHLAVIEGGRLAGVVSSHDILLLQGAHPVALAREIEGQPSLDGLAESAPKVLAVVKWLANAGAGAFDIGRIVAELNDRLVRRAVALVEGSLAAEGHGQPPVRYSWLAAGSEGRREQTLKTDQDNALVYEDPPRDLGGSAEVYFGRLASLVGGALERLGLPLCDGGFMASNPKWCQPESVWRGYFGSWMGTPHPEWVLSASIYFDLRPVAGDEGPGRRLWEWVCERAPAQVLFLRYLARAAVDRQPPLGFLGGFVVERSGVHKGGLDLKARGVFPVTQAMRAYALSLGVRETNTVGRLGQVGARGVFADGEVQEIRDAYEVVCRLRLARQIECLDAGAPPDNFVDPRALGKADRLLLKEAFKTVGWLQRALGDRFQTASLG